MKAAFDINARNKLVFSAYTGYDNFNLTVKSTTKIYDKDEYVGIADQTNKNTIGWGNRFFTTRWSHVFSNKLFSNATLLYSDYGFNIYSENVFGPQKSSVNYISSIATGGLRYDMEYFFSSKHHLKFGLHSLLHRFNPSATIQTKDVNATAPENPILGLESAIYLEDDFKISQRWRAIAGVRLSHFVARNRQYMMPEPRISIQYKLLPDLSVKANYTLMNQYLHMVQNSGTNLPTDIWVPSTEKILPQYAQQWALGIVKDFDKQHFFISLEAYYKKMENILGYKEGSNFLFLNGNLGASKNQLDWQNNVNQGQAWSYGTELLIQKKEGRFNGWIGYTLSWNIMQFDAVNFGKPFFAKYDRRHDISITGNYKLTNKITISATWVYTTGNRLTLPIGKVHDYELNKPMTLYSDKNSIQVKPYHRLDVGVQFHKNLKKGRQRIWEISIYNVYNRLNTFYYFTQADEVYSESGKIIGSSISLKEVSVLPIIPSLSYTFKF